MDALREFTIPIKGLGLGIHQYEFELDKAFFAHFEDSPIADSDIIVQLDLDKRLDMMVIGFDISGSMLTNCDRCLEEINLPFSGQHQLIVKLAHEASEEEMIVYITEAHTELNLAKYIYEFCVLSIPMVRILNEDESAHRCDEEVIKHLGRTEQESSDKDNPLWDALKGFKEN